MLKILEGFTEKTEGSYITKKETIISWMYKDCDIYFGHIQANEINTHLQNIFENCKLDIVNGKGYVEIKPRNVNKGYFVSHILKNEFLESTPPDFILTIGDDTSDEEMFKYLNSVQHHISSLKENTKIFTCTIGRKPSSAQYYLNEVHEVIEYLESLNQINNSLRYDRSGHKFAAARYLSEKNLLKLKSQMKSESNLSYTNLNKKFNI